MNNALSQFLAATSVHIDTAFNEALNVPALTPHTRVVDAMRYSFLAGGKRVRPTLTAAWGSIYNLPTHITTQVGLAIECIHTYSLIHDDLPCMDDDTLRRGKPTCHVEFDECTAVLAGDALQALAFHILSTLDIADTLKVELIKNLSTAVGPHGMVGGQMWDMLTENTQMPPLIEPELTQLQSMKTGALITFSCQAAAILAQEDDTPALEYGKSLGALFQITDDLLDISEHDLGKTSRKDEASGKTTFVSLLGAHGAENKADTLLANCQKCCNKHASPLLSDLAAFVRHRTK